LRVVGIDPGGTTGTAMFSSTSLRWYRSQLEGEHHSELWAYLEKVKPHVLVCESWQNRGKDAADITAPQYIGICKLYASSSDLTKFVSQSPATGKGFWNDGKLKRVGLYMPGNRHAMDATRHVLYFLTQNNLLPDIYLRSLRERGTSLALTQGLRPPEESQRP
jgi:hypothetical protein